MGKEQIKYKRYGNILYHILKIVSKTLKIQTIRSPEVDSETNYVYSFWHNKLVVASLCLNYVDKRAVLASPSKDGELIAVPLERMGFRMVRGSSDKEGVRSLITLISLIKKGYNAGTPVDGPKGPIYKVKPGMLYLAQKSGKKIVPVGGAFSKKWVFEKAWDKFQFPKPFSKMICIIGDPIEIPKDAVLEDYTGVVEKELNKLNEEAENMLNN